MVKGVVKLVCPMCGKVFTRERVFRDRREADIWEEWLWKQAARDGCPACYKGALALEFERQVALAMSECPIEFPILRGKRSSVVGWGNRIRERTIIALSTGNFEWSTILDAVGERSSKAQRDIDLLFTEDAAVWVEALGKQIFGKVYVG
jgi:hypothetical protein